MHRVLRPGGVAVVSVWSGLDGNPYIAALAKGLERHLSPAAGASMAAPCGFGDPGELRELFVDAGFAEVVVSSPQRKRAPTPALEAIAGNLAALPIADQVQAMSNTDRSAMLDDMLSTLSAFIDDGQLTAPATSNVAIATA